MMRKYHVRFGGRLTEKCLYTRVTRRLPILPSWLPQLAEYGYTQQDIQFNPCTNVMVGTWILSQKMTLPSTASGSYWQQVANYHSVTPKFNQDYQHAVKQHYQQLSAGLSINL